MVTIVVPVFNLTDERYRNFWFIFSRICAEGLPLVVVEQYDKFPLLAFPESVGHIKYHSSSEKIEKSKLINEAAKNVGTDYIWINDADVWNNYGKVMEYLKDFKGDALRPFKHFVKFEAGESKDFIVRKEINASLKNREKIKDYGAGSFIVRTSVLRENPLNEEFIGWGFEDIEWGRKISEKYEVKSVDAIGVHLYHDQPKENRSRNEKVYKRSRDEVDIYHVLNVVDFPNGSRMQEEQDRTIKSLEKSASAVAKRIHLIAAHDDREDMEMSSMWFKSPLTRTADRDIDGSKNFAYVKDLMDAAYDRAEDRDDWIMFTNSDCFSTESFHKELLSSVAEVILFHRDDIDKNGNKKVFEIGCDGLAVRKAIWKAIRDDFDDYLIGVPSWDTYTWYYFVKNSGYDVIDNLGGLMHYKHERTWDFYNPDPPGQYNKDLFFSYVDKGKAVMKPMNFDNPGDTAIVMGVWGQNKNRIASTKKVLSKLGEQYLESKLFFVEMLFDDEESPYSECIEGEHIIVRGAEKNKDIFQKEALWNIGASHAKDCKYVIFCDSDIWSKDPFWFYKIRNKIKEDQRTVVQGANFSYDTEDDGMNFQTMLASKLLVPVRGNRNPGLIYGMTREYYEDIGGFNPLFLVSCGDSGFINEVFRSRNYEKFLRRFPFFENNLRDIREAQPSVVDVDIIHEFHGKANTRNYVNVDFAINAFRTDLKDLIQLGDNKLVEWIDPECKERLICREGKNMKKREDVVRIFSKHNMNHLPRRIIFNHIPFSTYNIVEDYLSDFFEVFYIGSDGKDIATGVHYDDIESEKTFVLTGKNVFRQDIFIPSKDDFYMTFIRNPHDLFIADYSFCHNLHNVEEITADFTENNGNTFDQYKIDLKPKEYVDWFLDDNASSRFFYMPYYMGIDRHGFVGSVENMGSSVMALCQHLFLPFEAKNIYHEDESYLIPKRYRMEDVQKKFSLQIEKYQRHISYYNG